MGNQYLQATGTEISCGKAGDGHWWVGTKNRNDVKEKLKNQLHLESSFFFLSRVISFWTFNSKNNQPYELQKRANSNNKNAVFSFRAVKFTFKLS